MCASLPSGVGEVALSRVPRSPSHVAHGECNRLAAKNFRATTAVAFRNITTIFQSTSTGLSVCLYVCLAVWLSICLYVCISACLYVCLSVCLSVGRSVCLYVYMSACQSVCLFVCLSVCLSVWLYVCLYSSSLHAQNASQPRQSSQGQSYHHSGEGRMYGEG